MLRGALGDRSLARGAGPRPDGLRAALTSALARGRRRAADADRPGVGLDRARALRRRRPLARSSTRPGAGPPRCAHEPWSPPVHSTSGGARTNRSSGSAGRASRILREQVTGKASTGLSASWSYRWSGAIAAGHRTVDADIAIGDRAIAAGGRLGQDVIAYCQGDYAGARGLLQTSLELFAGVPDEPHSASGRPTPTPWSR